MRVVFADSQQLADLEVFLKRLDRVAKPEVAFKVTGRVLSVYGCTQAPEGLLDLQDTVLVHRAFALAAVPQAGQDAEPNAAEETQPWAAQETQPQAAGLQTEPQAQVAPLRSFFDRFAKGQNSLNEFDLPESSMTAAWAGVLPPRAGWQHTANVSASSLAEVASQGMKRVAELVPQDAGGPVTQKVRQSVWGLEVLPGISAAAAFALEVSGFLQQQQTVRVHRSLVWSKLSTPYGDVLLRRAHDFINTSPS